MSAFLISSDHEAQVRHYRQQLVESARFLSKLRDSSDDTPQDYQDHVATCDDSLSSAIDDLDQILTKYTPQS